MASSPIFFPFKLKVREQKRREAEDQFMRSLREEQLAAQRVRNAALTRQGDQRNSILGMNARTSLGNLEARRDEFSAGQEEAAAELAREQAERATELTASGTGVPLGPMGGNPTMSPETFPVTERVGEREFGIRTPQDIESEQAQRTQQNILTGMQRIQESFPGLEPASAQVTRSGAVLPQFSRPRQVRQERTLSPNQQLDLSVDSAVSRAIDNIVTREQEASGGAPGPVVDDPFPGQGPSLATMSDAELRDEARRAVPDDVPVAQRAALTQRVWESLRQLRNDAREQDTSVRPGGGVPGRRNPFQ